MLGEIVSAVLGNAVAKLLSKWAPPRRAEEFSKIPREALRRRNRSLYFGASIVATLGFVAPYIFFLLVESKRGGWIAGAMLGLPFSGLLVYIAVIWSVLGAARAREFLGYFEAQQKMSIYIFYIAGIPLSLIGF